MCMTLKKQNKPDIAETILLMFVYDKKEKQFLADPYDIINPSIYTRVIPVDSTKEIFLNHFLPLRDFQWIQYEDRLELRIFDLPEDTLKGFDLKKKYKRGALTLTTDPRVESASDWSDLGMFRLLYKFNEPKLSIEENTLLITIQLKEGQPSIGKDLFLADREI